MESASFDGQGYDIAAAEGALFSMCWKPCDVIEMSLRMWMEQGVECIAPERKTGRFTLS